MPARGERQCAGDATENQRKVGSLERGLGATLTSGWMTGHKEEPS